MEVFHGLSGGSVRSKSPSANIDTLTCFKSTGFVVQECKLQMVSVPRVSRRPLGRPNSGFLQIAGGKKFMGRVVGTVLLVSWD